MFGRFLFVFALCVYRVVHIVKGNKKSEDVPGNEKEALVPKVKIARLVQMLNVNNTFGARGPNPDMYPF